MPAPLPRPPFWRRRRVVVRDDSMRPTLRPDDRLWVDTGAFRRRAPLPGEIVVFGDGERPGRWLVKRVERVDPAGAFVLGDAGGSSRDSRTFGAVPLDRLVGCVVACYAPPARRRSFVPPDDANLKPMWK